MGSIYVPGARSGCHIPALLENLGLRISRKVSIEEHAGEYQAAKGNDNRIGSWTLDTLQSLDRPSREWELHRVGRR